MKHFVILLTLFACIGSGCSSEAPTSTAEKEVAATTLKQSKKAPAKPLPEPLDREIDFEKDIKGLLNGSCSNCHNKSEKKGKLDLTTHEALLAGGKKGAAIIPGNSEDSLLIKLIWSGRMPKKRGGGRSFTPEEVALFRAWIDQGAKWGAEEAE